MTKVSNLEMISIIMPVYNTGHFFFDSYKSILNQNIDNYELIVVDDGSINDTYSAIKEFSKSDKRIKLYQNKENMGVAFTRNYAMSKAQGKYLAFLDCGDIWLENKLALQISKIKKTESDLCFTSYQYFDPEEKKVRIVYRVPECIDYKTLLKENYIGCSTVLINRERIRDLSFDAAFFHEDYVLWLKLIRSGKKFVGIENVLTDYRIGGRSSNKIKAAHNRWLVYRNAEKLNFFSSLYYFLNYITKSFYKFVFRKRG